MQVYDLIMLIVIGMATIFGAIKGFAWQVASLASIVVSYIVAYRFRFQVAELIEAKPPWNQFLAMLLLYVGTSFVIWVGFRLLSGMIDRVRLKEFDRHLGAAFGFAKGLIFCLLITMFAMSLLGPAQQSAICHSRSGYYIATALDRGVGVLPKEIHDVVGPYLAQLDTQLKDKHSVPSGGQDAFWNDTGSASRDDSAWPDGLQNLPSQLPSGGNLPNLQQLQQMLPENFERILPGTQSSPGQLTPPQIPNNWNSGELYPQANSPSTGIAAPQVYPPLGGTGAGADSYPGSGYSNSLNRSEASGTSYSNGFGNSVPDANGYYQRAADASWGQPPTGYAR